MCKMKILYFDWGMTVEDKGRELGFGHEFGEGRKFGFGG